MLRNGHIAHNAEVPPLQECVENAGDVRLRVYDTDRPVLYSWARDRLTLGTLARRVSFLASLPA